MFLLIDNYILAYAMILLAMVGVYVLLLFRGNKTKKSVAFLWLFLVAIIWMIFDFLTAFSFNESFDLYIWRLGFGMAFLLSIFSFIFICIYFSLRFNLLVRALLFVFSAVVLLVSVLTGTVIKSIYRLDFPGQSNYIEGGGFLISSILIATPVLFSFIYSLFRAVYTKDLLLKRQYLLISGGLLWSIVFSIVSNIIFPYFDVEFYKLAHVGVFGSMLLFLYIMIKYNTEDFSLQIRKISSKISIYSIFQFFIIIFFFVVTLNYVISDSIIMQVNNNLQSISQARADHINTYFIQNIERLKLITSRTKLRELLDHYNQSPNQDDLNSIKSIITDAAEPIEEFERICIVSLEGTVLTSTSNDFCGNNVENESFFIKGRAVNDIHFVEENGDYKIFVSGPIELNERLIGVGVTVVNVDYLKNILFNRTGLGDSGEVMLAFLKEDAIIYPIREIVVEQGEKTNLVSSRSDVRPMAEVLSSKRNTIYNDAIDYRDVHVLAATQFIKTGNFGLVTKIDRNEALNILNWFSLMFMLGVILAAGFYYLLSKKTALLITAPIQNLENGAKAVASGNYDMKIGVSGDDEIARFSRLFDEMSEKVKESRREINVKVLEQTQEINKKALFLERQRNALMNITEDLELEKKKAEEFASDLEKFKLAVEGASDHIVITNSEGEIIFANEAVEKITGYSRNEIIGQKAGSKDNWGGYMQQGFYDKLWHVIKQLKQPFAGEINNKKKWGEEYVAQAKITPILDKDGQVIYFVGIERDITKEKQIDQAKTEFVSIASHQLRTPLSAVKWYSEMLLNGDAGQLNEEQMDFVKEISKGNDRMVDLVDALLDVSRIELGTFSIEPQMTNLIDLSKDVVNELKGKIQKKKLKVKEIYGKDVPEIMVDPRLTRMIFQNLLSNAVKYISEKGKINVKIEKEKKDILITVEDNGFGIPERQKEYIFTKLFRADNVKEKDTEGTGLGLYIIKSIVEHSGGKIWFESKEGKGTIFFVTLPISGMAPKKGTKQLGE